MKPPTKDKIVFRTKPALNVAENLVCKILSDERIKFTTEKAFAFLELDTFQGERPVNERHVQFLFNAWSGGRFMWDHVILCQCRFNGKAYRINGQHTCWMRVNIPEDWFTRKSETGKEPMVREVIYQVDFEEQLRILYSTFDQNKTRTPAHVFKALLSGTHEVQDLWPSILPTLGAGMKMWLFEKDRSLVSSNDLAALVSDKHNALFKIVGLYYQAHYGDSVFMRRAAVIAALFATFNSSVGKAPEFWDPVFTGLNLTEKTDARYSLRKFLETHKQSLVKSPGAVQVSTEDTYRVCILAWNKWRTGQKVLAALRPTEGRHKAK